MNDQADLLRKSSTSQLVEPRHATGLLPSQVISEMIRSHEILCPEQVLSEQVQPASLDLRLDRVAYRVRSSFLPGSDNTVREKLRDLTMGEIVELDIKADFVCLSACETGVGKVYFSEGVINFAQAFMEAGSNSVSVTLWPIFDESTSEFMVSMYEKVADGVTYSKAINETKRDFIAGEYGDLYKHPFFWAPYVYYGK